MQELSSEGGELGSGQRLLLGLHSSLGFPSRAGTDPSLSECLESHQEPEDAVLAQGPFQASFQGP